MKIENYVIRKKNPVFLIAEAGVNYNNKLSLAFKMIDIAKKQVTQAKAQLAEVKNQYRYLNIKAPNKPVITAL